MEISWNKLADEIRQKIKSYTQLVDGWQVCKKSVSLELKCQVKIRKGRVSRVLGFKCLNGYIYNNSMHTGKLIIRIQKGILQCSLLSFF